MNKPPTVLKIMDICAAIAILAATGMVLFYAPVEKVMGAVQKLFYFHVSVGWVGMLAFLAAAVCGFFFLRSGDFRWDVAGVAAVEIGVIFVTACIITGSLWAKPIWNTYWTWDPRLTTAAILVFIYIAYFLLRQGVDDPDKKARFAAVYAIIGFVSVPLTFISIRLFRTIHPVVIGSSDPAASGMFDMTYPMRVTFFVSLAAFSLLFIVLFWHRIRLGEKKFALEKIREIEED